MVLSRVKARTHEIEIFGNYFIQFRTVNKRPLAAIVEARGPLCWEILVAFIL